jgi:hypothetical protein
MSDHIWRITSWKPGALPVELFVPDRTLLKTSSDGKSCSLQWDGLEMTLTGDIPGIASGTNVQVRRSGLPILQVNATAQSTVEHGEWLLAGTLQPAGKKSLPPGTFAATADPN